MFKSIAQKSNGRKKHSIIVMAKRFPAAVIVLTIIAQFLSHTL